MFAYMFTQCPCCHCGFACNPIRVPSITIDGVRVAICKNCFEFRQKYREANDLPRETYAADAYEPVNMEEVEPVDPYAEQADAEAQWYQENIH